MRLDTTKSAVRHCLTTKYEVRYRKTAQTKVMEVIENIDNKVDKKDDNTQNKRVDCECKKENLNKIEDSTQNKRIDCECKKENLNKIEDNAQSERVESSVQKNSKISKNSTINTDEIEQKIGYVFKDKALLERAFTHSSKSRATVQNYQSLEFFGDSIVDFIIAKRLMEIFPSANEGDLTRRRANIVSRQPLSDVVEKFDLEKYLVVGKGENQENISEQLKIKSDIYEALIGAIYYDSDDIATVEKFILSTLAEVIEDACVQDESCDFKSKINEYCSKTNKKFVFKLENQDGPPHNPMFHYQLIIGEAVAGVGSGHTKRDAQQHAAAEAIKKLKIK